jgi:hypothetical protein
MRSTDALAPEDVMSHTKMGGAFSRKPAGTAFQMPSIPMKKMMMKLRSI